MLERILLDWASEAPVAVLVEDEAGICVLANRPTESLLGFDTGALAGRACSEVSMADPLLIHREHLRLAQEKFWYGNYGLRSATNFVVWVHSIAFARSNLDGSTVFIHLFYPTNEAASVIRAPEGTSARHRCVLQLIAEGLSDEQLTHLLGMPEAAVRDLVEASVGSMDASSRTEACIKAMKCGVVA